MNGLKVRVILDPKDDWSLRGFYNEAYYMACTWWHRKAVADYYHPPRRYRSWDIKLSFFTYGLLIASEAGFYLAFRHRAAENVTNTISYVVMVAVCSELLHHKNLSRWRERTESDDQGVV